MKCLVCGKEYEAAECPTCRFPNVQIMGDREQVMVNLKPTIDAYRTRFLQSVKVQILAYRWKDQNGTVVQDRVDTLTLGRGDVLLQEETWIPEKFARIAEKEEIPVTLRITAGEETRELVVAVPNLQKPELQQLGASIDNMCNLRLLLRNDTDAPTSSAPVPLFA